MKIAAAKGRPMLTWVGKRPLERVTAFPAQHVETFDPSGAATDAASADARWEDWPEGYPQGGLLFHGDNKEVLAHLLASGFRGKVKLIYIDPPFDSGADYVRKVSLRGVSGSAKIEGETYTLGEQIQYTDIWANDNYLQFMYERLLLLKELLAEDGSLWVHCDWRKTHHVRCLLDEVFGAAAFADEIIWKSQTASGMKALANQFSYTHETLLWYGKGEQRTFHRQYRPYSADYVRKRFRAEDERGRYKDAELQDPSSNTLSRLKSEGRLIETAGGKLRVKQYLDESPGILIDSVWTDIPAVNSQAVARTEYPTQKPVGLLERVVAASSNPGDLVLDCFLGSGTTAAVAQKLGRRWIGCDINKGAIQTTSKRLQGIIREQLAEEGEGAQTELEGTAGADAPPAPAQRAFTVWRVNEYDLQIQHNEAVALACEHIGVERNRADGFFDGTRGKELVRVIPFGRPLTPLDLEEVKRELEARPDEDRDVLVVCLGKEQAADAWLEEWGRMRRGAGAINRIRVIELRTDPRYGKFIVHRPAEARVEVARSDGKLKVEIQGFISPSIVERLEMDVPLFRAKIPDWRSMVDSVLIDPSYDGEVFSVVVSDAPARKDEMVSGSYELDAPAGETTVAVKIIDMLGEEVLVQAQV